MVLRTQGMETPHGSYYRSSGGRNCASGSAASKGHCLGLHQSVRHGKPSNPFDHSQDQLLQLWRSWFLYPNIISLFSQGGGGQDSSISATCSFTAMLLGCVNMVVYSTFTTASWFLTERVGRRKLFQPGTAS
ncbi:hypothetical protein HCEG_04211 [Histoplasma capsulatum var. duboisii H88]|uniref:Sugar transporter n=1 Tax=Ajellomyces capsulatus (strain H88) TaxID=544711 RepID=F0UFP4_AJEC8|nr:hypothetical protein HCEG_04211 [Histoplasma capsulatum var. duboisii H88]